MSHKNKKFSTKFDDLGVIIMGNRCSIQQGEENYNCWSEQSPEKSTVSTVSVISGPPGYKNQLLLVVVVFTSYLWRQLSVMVFNSKPSFMFLTYSFHLLWFQSWHLQAPEISCSLSKMECKSTSLFSNYHIYSNSIQLQTWKFSAFPRISADFPDPRIFSAFFYYYYFFFFFFPFFFFSPFIF